MTRKEANPVSKRSIQITSIILFAALIIIVAMIIRAWTLSERKRDSDFIGYVVMFGAIAVGGVAYNYNRKLTLKYNEWEYRQSAKITREPELTLADHFIFSRVYKKGNDDYFTHVYHYVMANGSLFQIHSFCEENFKKDFPAVNAILKAKIVEEDNQEKIIEFTLVTGMRAKDYRNNQHGTIGVIAEKFFGSLPTLTNGRESSFGRVQYPRERLNKEIKLSLVEGVVKSQSEGDRDRFFFRINRYFVPVTAQDFLKYNIGNVVSFTVSDWEAPAIIQLQSKT